MEDQEGPILDAVCELAPPLVHFPDNLSSDCTDPALRPVIWPASTGGGSSGCTRPASSARCISTARSRACCRS